MAPLWYIKGTIFQLNWVQITLVHDFLDVFDQEDRSRGVVFRSFWLDHLVTAHFGTLLTDFNSVVPILCSIQFLGFCFVHFSNATPLLKELYVTFWDWVERGVAFQSFNFEKIDVKGIKWDIDQLSAYFVLNLQIAYKKLRKPAIMSKRKYKNNFLDR